jgi:hypothetical protein
VRPWSSGIPSSAAERWRRSSASTGLTRRAVDRERQAVEIRLADDPRDDRHDPVADERVDDGCEHLSSLEFRRV